VSSNFEQKNVETVKKIRNSFYTGDCHTTFEEWESVIDLSYKRAGQDVRYSINDDKIRRIGWRESKTFDGTINEIVRDLKLEFRC